MSNKQCHFDTMFRSLAETMKPYTEMIELTAIWIGGKRYAKGDNVYLDTSLESFTKDTIAYTHVISKCMGTIGDYKHEITFTDLKTNEQINISL